MSSSAADLSSNTVQLPHNALHKNAADQVFSEWREHNRHRVQKDLEARQRHVSIDPEQKREPKPAAHDSHHAISRPISTEEINTIRKDYHNNGPTLKPFLVHFNNEVFSLGSIG